MKLREKYDNDLVRLEDSVRAMACRAPCGMRWLR